LNGPVTDQGGWKFTTPKDLKQLYNSPDLVLGIKRRKLQHVIRVDQTRVAKKTYESNPEGRRKARMLRFMGFIYGWKMQTVIYESKI
jgi:hypothetical protein